MYQNHQTGKTGENAATVFLEEKGYAILERNWRHHHLEIDIIASKDNILQIIEVKTRHSIAFGWPEQSISKNKMRFLKNAAEAYQFQNKQWKYLQFNVVSISMDSDNIKEIFLLEDVYL
jgi:putative endonuclease